MCELFNHLFILCSKYSNVTGTIKTEGNLTLNNQLLQLDCMPVCINLHVDVFDLLGMTLTPNPMHYL